LIALTTIDLTSDAQAASAKDQRTEVDDDDDDFIGEAVPVAAG
jgi:hypothetical protein